MIKEKWIRDKELSAKYYQQYAPRILEHFFGAGSLQSVEDKADQDALCKLVDTVGGIDYFYGIRATPKTTASVIGIASRVSFEQKEEHKDAFKIRYRRKNYGYTTEFKKLLQALRQNTVHPTYLSSMFVSDRKYGVMESVGMCKTIDLYLIFKDIGMKQLLSKYLVEWTKFGGDADFISFPWRIAKQYIGKKVLIIRNKDYSRKLIKIKLAHSKS